MISQIKHPEYREEYDEFIKWRLAYDGGREFVKNYLQVLSKRELPEDFDRRKLMAYVPKFAAAALNKIKDAIYSRMGSVERVGGPKSYMEAISGLLGGVDLQGSTMNTFMGTKVLLELMLMRKVGILVDAPMYAGKTLLDKGNKHPFLSLYERECIRSWNWVYDGNVRVLDAVLLEEFIDVENEFGLPYETTCRYRYMKRTNGGVLVSFYSENKEVPDNQVMLNVPRIPFEIVDIPVSLMQGVADYQAALMNLESSDVSYAMKSNYPFFYEFYDPKSEPEGFKPLAIPTAEGTVADQQPAKQREVAVGGTQGRRYPKGVESPGFTNPSPETLEVSMKKGQQIKDDIFRLMNLNLENSARSAESKEKDQQTIESALSFFGLMLQKAEIQVGELWAMFEGSREYPKVTYPEDYTLKTQEERNEEAEQLTNRKDDIPSMTYKKAVAKKIARLTIGPDVSTKEWKKIESEIDNAETLTSNPEQILADHEAGLVSDETAAVARGYKKEEVAQARKDRAERIKLTLEAQGGPENASAARGASEFGGKTGADEKIGKEKRGEAK